MKKIVAGVDEVGRGSLIGPVYAAAVIFKKNIKDKEIIDSKKIKKIKREIISKDIKKNSIWAIGSASLKEIENFNILNASLLAMKRAIEKLKIKPNLILIDGNKSPKIKNCLVKTVIKGDQKIKEISAASIIAKVSRDKLMNKMSKKFKKYKWDLNAGYGTKEHIKAIKKYGITKFHRKTFKPVHKMLSLKKS
jgi:ribonuclease HII